MSGLIESKPQAGKVYTSEEDVLAVYVDNAFLPFGRMKMSHLMADELDELHEFAERIGLKRRWFQDGSIPHYDVSKSLRERAIQMGAIPEDWFSDSSKAFRREQRRKARARAADRASRASA